VLAGAVAKGAFHAGVLSVIAELGIRVTRIVATSAGALTGCVYAAGIRAGRETDAASRLVSRWRDRGDWDDVFSVAPLRMLEGRGLSSMRKIRQMLKEAVQGFTPAQRAIELNLVIAPLRGCPDPRSGDSTTFEHPAKFQDTDFDTADGWDRICDVALASAAFPFVFVPADIPNLGPCIDGGAVNNTPIHHAIDGSGTDVIIVVSPYPTRVQPEEPIQGLNLALQLADILINERLFRDLQRAASINDKLDHLDALVRDGRLSPGVRDEIIREFKWRRLRVIPVRPDPARPLPGNAFSAFFDAQLRRSYVDRGIEEARATLKRALAAGVFDAPPAEGAPPRRVGG
jgi:NTE family protein